MFKALLHTGPWDSKPQFPHFINRKITRISPRDLAEVRCVIYVNPLNSSGNIGGIKEKKVSYDYPTQASRGRREYSQLVELKAQ